MRSKSSIIKIEIKLCIEKYIKPATFFEYMYPALVISSSDIFFKKCNNARVTKCV